MDSSWAVFILLLTVLSLASVFILAWALFYLRRLQGMNAQSAFMPAPSLRVYLWSLVLNAIIMPAVWRTSKNTQGICGPHYSS